MRLLSYTFPLALALVASGAFAQEAPSSVELGLEPPEERAVESEQPTLGGSELERSVALSVDERAQLDLGGFRAYLERIRPFDARLYRELDPPARELEERDEIATISFGFGLGLSLAALGGSIPLFLDEREELGWAALAGAGGFFAVGLLIYAIVRPEHSDLQGLIDRLDRFTGRR